MFELKYKITDADMKKVNQSIMWQYFVPYLIVALLGIGAGVAAVILNIRTDVLVLGIVLLVLGAILLVCSVLLLIAPKNFVVSALVVSDSIYRTVKIGNERIDIETPGQENIELAYGEITKLKNKKSYLLAYVGKDIVLVLKDSSESKLNDVYNFMLGKIQNAAPVSPAVEDSAVKSATAEQKPVEQKPAAVNEEVHSEIPAEEPKEEVAEEKPAEQPKKEEKPAAEVKEEPAAEEEKPEDKPKEVKKPAAKKTSTGKTSTGKSSTGKSSTGKSSTGKTSTTKSSTGKSSTGKKSAPKKM